MKRLLMLAYFFPPVGGIGSAGAQRVLKFAKYLKDAHWQPVIITVKEKSYEPFLSMDRSLLERVPNETLVLRSGVFRGLATLLKLKGTILSGRGRKHVATAPVSDTHILDGKPTNKTRYQRMKDAITDLFEIPDEEMGWFLPGVLAGLRAFARYGFDAIYSTGRPWTAHLIGLGLKALTGKPLIVDFRDPWMTNPFRPEYSSLRTRLETLLERLTIEKADLVISNTSELQEEFIKRFPRQPIAKFHTLFNGFDPDDFPLVSSAVRTHSVEYMTVTHTGFLYGKRDPRSFLDAIRRAIDVGYVNPDRFRVRFIGAIELPYDVAAYLSQHGLDKIVSLQPHVPYKDSLEFLKQSDLLLLLQPGTKTQIPSKVFEYIGVKKPILGISPLEGATANLLRRERLGVIADPDDVQGIAMALRSVFDLWSQRNLSSMMNGSTYQRFDVRNITVELAGKISQLCS